MVNMGRHVKTGVGRRPWDQQLSELRDKISTLADGPERDAAVKRAQQLEAAIRIEASLRVSET